MPVLCIYHANCADGLLAAWAVHRALPDAEFAAASYSGDPVGSRGRRAEGGGWDFTALRDRDVLIVDFSYPLATLRAIAAEARSVLVLDHHKTAQEDLATLLPPTTWIGDQETFPAPYADWLADTDAADQPVAAIFDMNRSGAGITWDYLNPRADNRQLAQIRSGVRRKWDVDPDVIEPGHVTKEIEDKIQALPRPRIVDLVEDRDLWRFKYGDETRAFHAVLASYDWTDLPAMFARLDDWDRASHRYDEIATDRLNLGRETRWEGLLAEGHAILRAHRIAVQAAVRATRRTMRLTGHVVPVANVPAALASDAGEMLNEQQTEALNTAITVARFSATYYDGSDGRRHFSLRSPPGGADVGAVAKRMAARFNALGSSLAEMAYDALGRRNVWSDHTWSGGGHAHAGGFDAPLGWEGE